MFKIYMARTWFLCVLLFGAAKREAFGSPLQEHMKDNVAHDDITEPFNGNLHTADAASDDLEKNLDNFPLEEKNTDSTSLNKKLAKRSAYDYEGPPLNEGYYGVWGKKNYIDPGYESYMQSIHYDPMMAWGGRKRSGGIERNYDSSDYPDEAYLSHLTERTKEPQDGYMESVYLPHHFFHAFKKSFSPRYPAYNQLFKRSPTEMGARGFHEGIFTHNFGDFSPVKRRKRDVEKTEEDTTHKMGLSNDRLGNSYNNNFLQRSDSLWAANKKRFGMDASGFHGDTFSNGWGTFSTMKKRRPEWDTSDYRGDSFPDRYGSFDTMNKRRPEMDAMGFHGDIFNGGFGDFYPMKRRPEMDSSGFHGDTFSNGFGDFYTMKKSVVSPSGAAFGTRTKRETMKPKRRPEMTSSGFYGDTFSNGFGDFYTMKRGEQKRRPEMTASGFHGDTFSNGFGDFYTMKKRLNELSSQILNRHAMVNPFSSGTPEGKTAIEETLTNELNRELRKDMKR